MKIDFFARRTHFIDHMLPVWRQLESERGQFFVPDAIADHARKRGVDVTPLRTTLTPIPSLKGRGEPRNAMLVCAYGDLTVAHRSDPRRKLIFMEHGVGITYGGHPGYAGGKGMRKKVSLFLAPNEIVRAKTERALPGVDQVVIGTPKLDRWAKPSLVPDKLEGRHIVCISFHWNGERVAPEAGNAFKHYRSALHELAACKDFKLIGHAHPRAMDYFAGIYKDLGIEVVRDFEEVMERAHVYVCDNSSTIYEFCVTGRPVIILNAPWYRTNIHYGIRFWDYVNIGQQLDRSELLPGAIKRELILPEVYETERQAMVKDLFPYLGESGKRAADAIREWLSHVP